MTEVLIVEDDMVLMDLLSQELVASYPGTWGIVHSTNTVAEAQRILSQRMIDVMITDLALPDGCGYDLAKPFSEKNPRGRLIVLSGQLELYGCPPCLDSILHAVVSKSHGLSSLRQALWSLRTSFPGQFPDISSLSPRQLEMLQLIGQGKDTLEIAEIMGVTFATAQTHRRQITSRLGVRGPDLINLARSLQAHHA